MLGTNTVGEELGPPLGIETTREELGPLGTETAGEEPGPLWVELEGLTQLFRET